MSADVPNATPDPDDQGSSDPDSRDHDRDPGAGSFGRESAYELLRRGNELSARRHYAQAAIVLERADRIAPGHGSILEPLGRAYYMSGQNERSAVIFGRLLEIDPSAHYAHFVLGQSLKRMGRLGAARTHLRLAVALSPASRLYRGALDRLPPERPPGAESGRTAPSDAADQSTADSRTTIETDLPADRD